MRTLKFIVKDQIITQDPNCDFGNLVPGTQAYLKAEFSFSNEWSACKKVVSFWSVMGKQYSQEKLSDGKSCLIPWEALNRRTFKIQVLGEKNGFKIKTNKMAVCQNGGNT